MNLLMIVPRVCPKGQPYRYVLPLGMAYIVAAIKAAGYRIDCTNLNHSPEELDTALKQALSLKSYDLVLTGGTCVHYRAVEAVVVASRRHSPASRIVLGGLLISGEPETVFADLQPDFGIIGEGDESIVQLIKCLENGIDPSSVSGIIFRGPEGTPLLTPPSTPPRDLDQLPRMDLPALGYAEWLENVQCNDGPAIGFFDYPRPYPIIGSRGCPFNCTFCWHTAKYRARSIQNIMDELDDIVHNFNIDFIWLYDECLSAHPTRLLEFCKAMSDLRSRHNRDIKWFCSLIARVVNPDILKVMKNSGCCMIVYGFESCSPVVLKSMGKPAAVEDIQNAFQWTFEAGIRAGGCFIFGDVAETMDTAKITLDYWKKNAQGQISLGFVTPYPRSKLYQRCIEKKLIKDKLDFIKNKIGGGYFRAFNVTDAMTNREFAQLRNSIFESLSKYYPRVRAKSLRQEPKPGLYSFSVVCPFCNHEHLYRNCGLDNRWTYLTEVTCRHCMKSLCVVGFVRWIAHLPVIYPILRNIRYLMKG